MRRRPGTEWAARERPVEVAVRVLADFGPPTYSVGYVAARTEGLLRTRRVEEQRKDREQENPPRRVHDGFPYFEQTGDLHDGTVTIFPP